MTQKKQKNSKHRTILFYSSKYIFPTQIILNSLSKLDIDNLDFIDVLEDHTMVAKHSLKELPTMIVMNNGIEEKRVSGSELIKNIDKYL